MNSQSKFDTLHADRPSVLPTPISAGQIDLAGYFSAAAVPSRCYEGQLSAAFQAALDRHHAGVAEQDCDFYHSMDLPSGRHFSGDWDLRGHEHRYVGGAFLDTADFTGKRIVEFGPASGALSVHLARLARELVVVDLPFGAGPELVPHMGVDMGQAAVSGAASAARLRNSWWFTKAALNYQAKAVYADLYQLPLDMGRFDVGVFGALLLHLSNPFKALAQAARMIDDALVVTDIDNAPVLPGLPRDHKDYPAVMAFNEGKLPFGIVHWWSLSPAAIARMLERLGFEDVRTDTHTPPAMAGKTSLFTVVGRRARRVQVAVPQMAAAVLPLPPPQARFLVSGTEDENVFLALGAKGFAALTDTLQRAGIAAAQAGRVLDFGCGVGRVLRHWAGCKGAELYGTDYQDDAISWCRENLTFARVQTNTLAPVLDYPSGHFNVIYCLSVFTHLPADIQKSWFAELVRILAPGGVIYFTVHGTHYSYLFGKEDAARFSEGRLVVTGAEYPGTNICAAFHPPGYVQREFADEFGLELLEHLPCGARGNPEQDSYLLRKPPVTAIG